METLDMPGNRDDLAHERIARLESVMDRHQKWLEDHQKCIHNIDKKMDVTAVSLNLLTDNVRVLSDTINRNADEGRKRHEAAESNIQELSKIIEANSDEDKKYRQMSEEMHRKQSQLTKWSPAIVLGGISALLMALESGTLKPLIKFLSTVTGTTP